MMCDGPAPQRRHAPPAGPPARPAEPSSPGCPAPGTSPSPDPARTTAPAVARQPAGPGSRPELPPMAEGHTRGAPQPTNDEAEPPAPPTQPQRQESTVGADENAGAPTTDTNTDTNGGAWRGNGPAGSAECRHAARSGTRKRRGLAQNLRDQLRTPNVKTVSADPQPQITRAPPPWRTWHFRQTQACRGKRHSEIHQKAARGPRPRKPHHTRPGTRPRGERHPTDTTATTIV